jgi:predicted transcriptional regulator
VGEASGPRKLGAQKIVWAIPGDTLREVARKMTDGSFSQLPVQESWQNKGRVTDLMICERLTKAEGPEVATLQVKDLDGWGRKFAEIPPNAPLSEIVDRLQADTAVLIRTGHDLREWEIVTRFDLLRFLA